MSPNWNALPPLLLVVGADDDDEKLKALLLDCTVGDVTPDPEPPKENVEFALFSPKGDAATGAADEPKMGAAAVDDPPKTDVEPED